MNNIKRGSGVAVWKQIAASLAQDISESLYAKGERLPAEAELAARFAVNRHTIRRAMADLEKSGLVRIEQGRGTFVQKTAIRYTLGKRTRFSENLRSLGMEGYCEVMLHQELRSSSIAEHLGLLSTDSILRVQVRSMADERVVNVAEHYFSVKRFPGLAERLCVACSVTKVYEQYGITDYIRKWSYIKATLPSDDVARLLDQSKTRPILKVEALNVDLTGNPLHYSETRFAGDVVQIVVNDVG